MRFKESEIAYVAWQNRATRFYVGARLLHTNDMFAPAAYCASQSIELLLKATLVFWDKSFHPEAAGHGIAKLVRTVRNKARNAKSLDVPSYFFFEKRFHSVSRYPTASKGLASPASFIEDLDSVFASLVDLVPFQFNTELKRILSGKDKKSLAALRKGNAQFRLMRSKLGIAAKRHNKRLQPIARKTRSG
jgi:HEPN domain-containing protein